MSSATVAATEKPDVNVKEKERKKKKKREAVFACTKPLNVLDIMRWFSCLCFYKIARRKTIFETGLFSLVRNVLDIMRWFSCLCFYKIARRKTIFETGLFSLVRNVLDIMRWFSCLCLLKKTARRKKQKQNSNKNPAVFACTKRVAFDIMSLVFLFVFLQNLLKTNNFIPE